MLEASSLGEMGRGAVRKPTVHCSVVDPVIDGAQALLAEVCELLYALCVANVADCVEDSSIRILFLQSTHCISTIVICGRWIFMVLDQTQNWA